MPIKGLSDNARNTSIDLLNARLADYLDLKMAIKQAHWTLKGMSFIGVHELLDQIAVRVEDNSDLMAERVMILDGQARGTAQVVADKTTLKPYPVDMQDVAGHIEALCERMADLGALLREAMDATGEAGDEGTADLFTGASRELDKDLWFLESHIRGPNGIG
jgi:starvation-inducible DNA-binding protein